MYTYFTGNNSGEAKYSFVFLIFTLLLFLLIFTGIQSIAQKPDLKFDHILEGLNSKQISRVYQDSQGYIWVATGSGLHRYNGITFDIYLASKDSNSIISNHTESIYEDKGNNLWIGTYHGICKYNRDTDDFTRFDTHHAYSENNASINIIFEFLEDDTDKLWITSERDGLLYFDQQKQEFIPFEGLSSNNARAICKEKEGILWVGTTDSGLNKINTITGEVSYFKHDPSNPHSVSSNHITNLEMGPDGNLWVATKTKGLNRMVPGKNEGKFYHYTHETDNPNSLRNNDIYTIYVDSKDRIWVGNENGGLHLYNKEKDNFYRYTHDPANQESLSHNSIWCIYEDRQNRFWVGTSVAGLNVTDKYSSKFKHYYSSPSLKNDLSNNIIRDFAENKEGNIWIATDGGGLNFFDRSDNTFTSFQRDPTDPASLDSDAIIALMIDQKKRLWIGTWAGGISILRDQSDNNFIRLKEEINDTTYNQINVFGITQDSNGYIWIASFDEGLFRYNEKNNTIKRYQYDPDDTTTITSDKIRRIFEDSQDNIWVITLDGLNLITPENKEKGIFKRFVHNDKDTNSIPHNEIQHIVEDDDQNIWLATSYGLAKYNRDLKIFESFYKEDGLPGNEIKSVVFDNNGLLWIGTTNGISRLDTETMKFKNYDKSDGLQGDEFSDYAATKLSTGELVFGGMNGFNIFHPDSIKDNPYKPPVHFTDFKLFNKSVDVHDDAAPINKHISAAEEIVLTHDQSVFTFEFIALNYTNAEQNQYAFMMEGFEKKWNYVGTQRNATYTSLDPGEYTFKVKASNNDGLWNEKGTSIKVIILPPWWGTWWFKLMVAFLVIASAISFYRARINAIRRQKNELATQVNEKTKELKNINRELVTQSKKLEKKNNELDQFAYIVSHDLKAPLRAVNNLSEWIEEDLEDGDEAEVKENMQTLRGRVDRMKSLIDGILQYSRVGRIKAEATTIDTSVLIHEVIKMVEAPASFTIQVAEKMPVIKANATWVEQIFSNLISNAIKYHDKPKGKIWIDCEEDTGYITFSVADDGPGIPDDYKMKIFGMFQTLEAKDTVESTGVGLAIVKKIVEEQGGEIWVESMPEEGSKFIFTLPKV